MVGGAAKISTKPQKASGYKYMDVRKMRRFLDKRGEKVVRSIKNYRKY